MTREEKQLLLRDLSARLPYNVVIRCTDNDTDYKCFLTTDILNELLHEIEYYDYKPYLRPMSSMTDEEREEFRFVGGIMPYNPQKDSWAIAALTPEGYDWLNAHHFDYRDLIPKGLALEALKGMYNSTNNV